MGFELRRASERPGSSSSEESGWTGLLPDCPWTIVNTALIPKDRIERLTLDMSGAGMGDLAQCCWLETVTGYSMFERRKPCLRLFEAPEVFRSPYQWRSNIDGDPSCKLLRDKPPLHVHGSLDAPASHAWLRVLSYLIGCHFLPLGLMGFANWETTIPPPLTKL